MMSKICSEEYDKVTCIFLGIQAEVSMIALDLTMVVSLFHSVYTLASERVVFSSSSAYNHLIVIGFGHCTWAECCVWN